MTAQDIAQKIVEHASHLGALLGHFQEAMRTHGEEAKAYPDLTAKVKAAQAKLADLTAQIEVTEAQLAKAQATKAKLMKDLSA